MVDNGGKVSYFDDEEVFFNTENEGESADSLSLLPADIEPSTGQLIISNTSDPEEQFNDLLAHSKF